MDGSATLTMKKSRKVTKVPASTNTSGHQPTASAGAGGFGVIAGGVVSVVCMGISVFRWDGQLGTLSRNPSTVAMRPSASVTTTSEPTITGSAPAGPNPQLKRAC